MRVFPVENDLFHVAERVEHEMITPFSPADGHGAISVHTGNENYSIQKEKNAILHSTHPTGYPIEVSVRLLQFWFLVLLWYLPSATSGTKEMSVFTWCSSALFAVLCWIIYIHN